MNVSQFSLWMIDLNPVKGSEQAGIRPCVILQTNAVSDYGRTTLIAPLTSKKLERIYPYEVKIVFSRSNGLQEDSKIKLDQIRVVSKERLIRRIGFVEKSYYEEIIGAIGVIFDLNAYFR